MKGKKTMSKHTSTTANATNANATQTTPPIREWDGPSHATLESVITGSTDRALGVGVMKATGKDGVTTGYLVSLARTRPNGKKVIYALQDLVDGMPPAFARTYNPFTRLYKTHLNALHKCEALSIAFKWEMLDAEKAVIEALKAAGKWDVAPNTQKKKAPKMDAERNGDASKRAVNAIDTAPSPFGALLDTLAGAEVMKDREVLVIPLLRVIHNALTVDPAIIERILDNACAEIIAEGEKTAAADKKESRAA